MSNIPALVICMGVSGVGKSTFADLIASGFDIQLYDADDFHSKANKEKMASGQALTDSDREPWMQDICAVLSTTHRRKSNCVLAHSALRRSHRDRLRQLGFRTLFLHLHGGRDLIARRIGSRDDHYMPASLLDSQFDCLENTDDESDVTRIDIGRDEAEILARMSTLVDELLNGNFE